MTVWKGHWGGIGATLPWVASALALPVPVYLHNREHTAEGIGVTVWPAQWALHQEWGMFGPQERMLRVQKLKPVASEG